MEKASTKIKTTPVKKISDFGRPPEATPESKPTVETRLSSTPKMKFLTYEEVLIELYFFIILDSRLIVWERIVLDKASLGGVFLA